MKRKISDLTDTERIETLDALYTAASTLKGRDATKRFLKDLLTTSERVMLGRRILIARDLLAGVSRNEIMARMRVGPDTVYRVQQWLDDTMPGYEDVVEEMNKAHEARRKPKHPEWGTFAYLKKKYPLHFLLWPSK
ncbi:hypothetical protein KGO06_00340 [Patescibacteria group bacterium]|nr:hypothetical protein [Patescibacteria group bacterium]